jgi:hypothetical protein
MKTPTFSERKTLDMVTVEKSRPRAYASQKRRMASVSQSTLERKLCFAVRRNLRCSTTLYSM